MLKSFNESQEDLITHVLIIEKGNIYIYGKCEQFKGAHFIKLVNNPINYAKAYLILHRLNTNQHPIEILRKHFKEIGKEDLLEHPLFLLASPK